MSNNIEYVDFLKVKLRRYFNIHENVKYDDMHFDLYAEFKKRNSRYMLSKKIEVYGFEENEFLFYKNIENEIKVEDIDKITLFLNDNLSNIIEVNNDHMSTLVTFILKVNTPINDMLKNKIEKFKYYKSFMFGFKGWVNCKIIVLDVNDEIITNKLGKKDKEKFHPAS